MVEFVEADGLKIAYDLSLLALFRDIRPDEELALVPAAPS